MNKRAIFFLLSILISVNFGCATKPILEGPEYTILGGPQNGTFMKFAKEISEIAREEGINLNYKSSRGSFENFRKVNNQEADFAFSFASHVYNARNGSLQNDSVHYDNIFVLGYLYGGQAHLVVSKHLNIDSAAKLVGTKIGVDRPGTGSYYQFEVFFKELGIRDKLETKHLSGYDFVTNIKANWISAFFMMSGYPNKAVTKVAKESEIILINLYKDGQSVGFFDKHPYFARTTIPKNTYSGIHWDTPTFEDPALLIAHSDVPDNVIRKILNQIYTDVGIKRLEKSISAAKFMQKNNGSYGISTPLHPGALEYYKELGLPVQRSTK